MFEAENISVDVPGKRLLHDVSLRLEPGRVIALAGPNGAGKSTLLKAMTGEMACSAGRVCLDGTNLSSITPAILASRRAVVPQASPLSFPFTALEVTLLGVTVPGFALNEDAAVEAAVGAIRSVGLEGYEDRNYSGLSGGEKQRVQIARALCQLSMAARIASAPLALLLDEPTSSLDLAHQVLIAVELRRQAEMGRAVLVVLHDLNLVASLADEVILLSRGRIAARGDAAQVLEPKLLSEVYGCEVLAAHVEGRSQPVILAGLPPTDTFREAAQ